MTNCKSMFSETHQNFLLIWANLFEHSPIAGIPMTCLCPTLMTCEWKCFLWHLNADWTLSKLCLTGLCFWLWRKGWDFRAILSVLIFEFDWILILKQQSAFDYIMASDRCHVVRLPVFRCWIRFAAPDWLSLWRSHFGYDATRASTAIFNLADNPGVRPVWSAASGKIPCPRANNGKLWSACQKRFLTPKVLGLHS